jgi:hypothetical protein
LWADEHGRCSVGDRATEMPVSPPERGLSIISGALEQPFATASTHPI